MNEGNSATTAVSIGVPTITVIQQQTDHSLLRTIETLQKISTVTSVLLLLVHLSFIIYLLQDTSIVSYIIVILPWPICLIVCIAKSMTGIITRILPFIWVGFALTSIGSILFLSLLRYAWWYEVITIFTWVAFSVGMLHGIITLSLAIKLQQLTPIEHEQNQNYMCKYNIQSYLKTRMIIHPMSYVEKSRKVSIYAVVLLLIACLVLIMVAYSIYPFFALFIALVYCLPLTVFLIISLVGVITRSVSAITIGFILCTGSWLCMFMISCYVLVRWGSSSYLDRLLGIYVYTVILPILGLVQCGIMFDYILVLLAVAKEQSSVDYLAQEMQKISV